MRKGRWSPGCERKSVPRRIRAEVVLRQQGRCADCGTRLRIGAFVFDHRPPLALRHEGENANDLDRLAAICFACNEQKTPRDLKEIARTRRLALEHQAFLEGMQQKVPGRRTPSPRQWRQLQRSLGRPLGPASPDEVLEDQTPGLDRERGE